jgi:hypothetical protein
MDNFEDLLDDMFDEEFETDEDPYFDDFPMSLEYDDDNPFEYHDEPDWNDF